MLPNIIEVLEGEGGELSSNQHHKGGKAEVHSMSDEVMVTEFHILQLDRFLEIRKTSGRRGHGGCTLPCICHFALFKT